MDIKYLKINEDDTNLYKVLCYVHKNKDIIDSESNINTTLSILSELVYKELYLKADAQYIHAIEEQYPFLHSDLKKVIFDCYSNGLKHEVFLQAIERFIESASIRNMGFDIIKKAIEQPNEEEQKVNEEAAAGVTV